MGTQSLQHTAFPAQEASSSSAATSATSAYAAAAAPPPAVLYPAPAVLLPPGWEEKTDAATARKYYVNHITQATQWDRPV